MEVYATKELEGYRISPPKDPIGYLVSDSIKISIAVYKPMTMFSKFMWKACFGFRYVKEIGYGKSRNS